MKSLKYFLPLLLFFLAFSACKKELEIDRTYARGRVLEYGAETPVAGATVRLLSCTVDGGLSDCREINRLTTDETGFYEMPFSSPGITRPAVEADKYYDFEILLEDFTDNNLNVISLLLKII